MKARPWRFLREPDLLGIFMQYGITEDDDAEESITAASNTTK